MVDAMRAMLDELMGKERNLPPEERTGKGISYKDAEICKYSLAGLCPYGLFKNTKSDLGWLLTLLCWHTLDLSSFYSGIATVLESDCHQAAERLPCTSGLCKYEVHEDDVEFPPAKEEWDKLEDSEKEQ